MPHRSPVSKQYDSGVSLSIHPTPRPVEPFVARTSWLKRCDTRHGMTAIAPGTPSVAMLGLSESTDCHAGRSSPLGEGRAALNEAALRRRSRGERGGR